MFSCRLLALGWFQLLEVTLRSYTHGPLHERFTTGLFAFFQASKSMSAIAS